MNKRTQNANLSQIEMDRHELPKNSAIKGRRRKTRRHGEERGDGNAPKTCTYLNPRTHGLGRREECLQKKGKGKVEGMR